MIISSNLLNNKKTKTAFVCSVGAIFISVSSIVYAVDGLDPTHGSNPYRYLLCDDTGASNVSRWIAACVGFKDGIWRGTSKPCENESPITEENKLERSEAFTKSIDRSCDAFETTWDGWLSPGESMGSNNCWGGSPNYYNGIETYNVSRIRVSSFARNTDGSCNMNAPDGENIVFRRERDRCSGLSCLLGNENNGNQCPALGNPINAGTGNKFQKELDYQSSGQDGLVYRRYYNSMGTGLKNRYGEGWSADYWQRIVPQTSTTVELRRPDGQYILFFKVDDQWQPRSNIVIQLEELFDSQNLRVGWRVILEDDTVEEFVDDGVVGRPISIIRRNGLTTILEYDISVAEGGDDIPTSLDRVTSAFGKTLTFHYDTVNRLVKVIDPAGNKILYEHDNAGNIIRVTHPDDTITIPDDNPSRVYNYENPTYPHLLTGITDENNNRFATWVYDKYGRATSSEHAAGVERVDIVYNANGSTTATDLFGHVQTYHFKKLGAILKITQIDGGPCSTCGGQNQNTTYDANGFVASRTDFNGNVTTFINNARGLEISHTEAAGTPAERTITTEWHPTFRLPTRITEPGKITTFTYDAQGRLLEHKEEVVP